MSDTVRRPLRNRCRIERVLRLPAHEIVLGAFAVVLVCCAHVIVQTVPFGVWHVWAIRERSAAGGDVSRRRCVRPETLARAIARSARIVPRSRCLVQALAGVALFRMFSYHPEFRIGVHRDTREGMLAHAWVVLDQKAVIGALDDLHSFAQLPLSGRSL